MQHTPQLDPEVRHYIYTTFAETSRPPTTRQAAKHFGLSLTEAEGAFQRLADAHQIALAPGTFSVWMAHPFSAIPTKFNTRVGAKEYWGN